MRLTSQRKVCPLIATRSATTRSGSPSISRAATGSRLWWASLLPTARGWPWCSTINPFFHVPTTGQRQ